MRNERLVGMFFALALSSSVHAQGFANLGTRADEYAQPTPETRFLFPDDHGAHPDFRIEWWYMTANLEDENGEIYGVQWTLFRNALSPTQSAGSQAWMGHAAVSSPNGHYFAERLARGSFGHAGVEASPFLAFIDEWEMTGSTLSNIGLSAQSADFAYDLSFETDAPFVPQGQNGYSVKSEDGLASHYYSQPFYTVSGQLQLPSGTVTVSGLGWLDREWSSQPLAANQRGWDWFSVHLEGGNKLMGFQLRSSEGVNYTVGTLIDAFGNPSPIAREEITMTPIATSRVARREIPTRWHIGIPKLDLSVELSAYYPDSWMATSVPYWEGPVQVTGSHSGVGYLEMTGYE